MGDIALFYDVFKTVSNYSRFFKLFVSEVIVVLDISFFSITHFKKRTKSLQKVFLSSKQYESLLKFSRALLAHSRQVIFSSALDLDLFNRLYNMMH